MSRSMSMSMSLSLFTKSQTAGQKLRGFIAKHLSNKGFVLIHSFSNVCLYNVSQQLSSWYGNFMFTLTILHVPVFFCMLIFLYVGEVTDLKVNVCRLMTYSLRLFFALVRASYTSYTWCSSGDFEGLMLLELDCSEWFHFEKISPAFLPATQSKQVSQICQGIGEGKNLVMYFKQI